jgi:hypothetical protein
MDDIMQEAREKLDELLVDLNERSEEVKENFDSFREVFGKEFRLQAGNFKNYRDQILGRGNDLIDADRWEEELKARLSNTIHHLRDSADRAYHTVKNRMKEAQ